jgi:hypothetical protein
MFANGSGLPAGTGSAANDQPAAMTETNSAIFFGKRIGPQTKPEVFV